MCQVAGGPAAHALLVLHYEVCVPPLSFVYHFDEQPTLAGGSAIVHVMCSEGQYLDPRMPQPASLVRVSPKKAASGTVATASL